MAQNARLTLEMSYRRLRESNEETLYLVAGENVQLAAEMLNWSIAQFYAAQNTQLKVLKERVKATEAAATGAKRK